MTYSESDTRAKLITPKILKSGWKENNIIREYYFTDGVKLIGNSRGKRYFVDYLLHFQNINLAIIEAKAENKNPLDGLQQAINYAEKLNIDFVYSTNGHKIYEHSLKYGKGEYIQSFPTPETLFSRKYKNIETKYITSNLYFEDKMKPRFYQQIAIQKTIEAITDNRKRVLLTLATGTGKTYIAFQIVYKLFNSRWNLSKLKRRPKLLFLADRNILADQSMNTFNPLEKDIIRINGKEIKNRGGKVPKNANIFFAIYQSIAERKSDNENDITGYYKQYPSDFFDLIIIDECHRGSANDESSWRKILEYFKSAVHLGLAATPKRDENGDTYKYFGEPIYEYSLKDGINDGFLTPYKVLKVQTDIDKYRFNSKDIISGDLKNQITELEEFENSVVIPKRTELIAKTILEKINPMDKSIIFCVNQDHSADMKISIDRFKTVSDNNYCVRVTSNEGKKGREFLEQFQNNDNTIPTILTSSKMLTTGVDAKNIRNIILTAPIKSMIEFKQIIGRGTRIFHGKDFFTIIDFVGATNLFFDKEWDGEAIETLDISENMTKEHIQKDSEKEDYQNNKVIIDIQGRELEVTNIEIFYVGIDGKPLNTENYLRFLIGSLAEIYNDENQLREIWSNPKERENLLENLQNLKIEIEQFENLQKLFNSPNSDIYDILAFLSFNLEIKTKAERILSVENSDFMAKFQSNKAKKLLEFILERYRKDGFQELASDGLSNLVKLSGLGTVRDIALEFGGISQMKEEYFNLQKEIYR